MTGIREITKRPRLISIDSRSIRKGDIFIAIRGKRYDGHDFVRAAFRKGAAAAVVSKREKIPPESAQRTIIMVRDTVRCLGDIAKAHRERFDLPVTAITGSNGKTTAKDMTAHVLSPSLRVLKNETSRNNAIGLPLTILRLDRRHDAAILEMGMNHRKEIDRLSEIAHPTSGVITNIAPSHLAHLGTLKNVFLAKWELVKRLPSNGVALLNGDDPWLSKGKGGRCRKVFFGIEKACDYGARNVRYRDNGWSFSVQGHRFRMNLLGRHNIYNALIAIGVGREYGIPYPELKRRIDSFRQISPKRLELKSVRGMTILDDSYNSNPSSMECALETLSRFEAGQKRIIVSGDMLELGPRAGALHRSVGKMVAAQKIDALITIGRLSRETFREAKRQGMPGLYHGTSHRDAARVLRRIARPGDAILVKGSRGMEMERIIDLLER